MKASVIAQILAASAEDRKLHFREAARIARKECRKRGETEIGEEIAKAILAAIGE